MNPRACAIHIGTSGWHYRHWVGPFYPERLPASRMLEHYVRHFDTVEINSSFYRLPPPGGVEGWREGTPPQFRFSAKGSRFLTHMKKLKDPAAGVEKFFERLDPLGRKLKCVVFQLPPWWEVNAARLEEFLEALPTGRRYAFEFRNQTWHTDEVYRILRRHRAAFCIYEIAGYHSEIRLTTDFTYVRLHGPGGAYQGSYTEEALMAWCKRVQDWQRDLSAVYIYFDNDQAAYAVQNAMTLQQLVRGFELKRTIAR